MIYYLHDDPTICAQMLDDKSLDKQIKAIAQVLCNVHHKQVNYYLNLKKNYPKADCFDYEVLKPKNLDNVYTKWASTCLANYKKLVDMGLAGCEEYKHREGCDHAPHDEYCHTCECYTEPHKLQPLIEWARDNVPSLPIYISMPTRFPLAMPDKYKLVSVLLTKQAEPRMNDVHLISQKEAKNLLEGAGAMTCEEKDGHTVIIESYRNYYRAKLKANATYTRRERPEWLEVA